MSYLVVGTAICYAASLAAYVGVLTTTRRALGYAGSALLAAGLVLQYLALLERARALLTSYGQYLAASHSGSVGVCIAGYEAELLGLPGKYAETEADLLLARVGDETAGCVAIMERVLADGTHAGEMKRLWVEPRFRGLGLGLVLAWCACIVSNCFGDRWTYLEITAPLWVLIALTAAVLLLAPGVAVK